MNKKFRAAHKNVDREVARVQSAANELEKCLQRPSTIADLTLALDNVAEKLTLLKRKVFALTCDSYDSESCVGLFETQDQQLTVV